MLQQGKVPAAGGIALRLAQGELLRLIDSEGGQTGDLVAYSADGRDALSSGRSFDYNGKVRLSTGDVLWSESSRRMLTIVSDDVGRHDMFHAACSREMYELQYGASDHPNCHDNLSAALRAQGVEPGRLPQPFNVFMNVDIGDDGHLTILPPRSRAGSTLVLRAEMPLVVALSACPAGVCNGGAPPRAISFEVSHPEAS
jgi:uncharacterized protein YcgI (DUF1989 family)